MFEFDINKLVKKTSKFIRCKDNFSKIQSKLIINIFDWRKICLIYFGFVSVFFSKIIRDMWNKDTLSYRSMVIKKLFTNSLQKVEKKKFYKLKIKKSEWNRLKKEITGERKRFRAEFTKFLNQKLNSKGLNCTFFCVSNWFSKENSRKKSSNFWNGKYKCKNCNKIAHASIRSENLSFVILKLKTDGGYDHDFIQSCERITGKKRDKITQSIYEKGHLVVQAENYLENKSKKKCGKYGFINLNTLHKMKSERSNIDMISTIYEFDTKAAKNASDEMFEGEGENFNGIKGYLQSIRSEPFGLLLVSFFQLKIWSIIQETAPIIFFDATGSILKDIPGQSKILLFSLVAHDTKNQVILPIGEFFTNSLTSRTISNYLSEFKDLIASNAHFKVQNKFPKILVLDFTWANINAVLEAFNKVTIYQYLQWAEELICKGNFKINNLINVKIFLCSTHFLKIVIQKAKKSYISIENSILKDFVLCFTLLQNCKILKQFEDLLIDLLYIFTSECLDDEVIEKINRVKNKIKHRDSKADLNESINQSKNDPKIEIMSYFTNDHVESLIKNSPFTKYFQTLLFVHKEKIKKKINNCCSNSYYYPKLFKTIEDKLYIVPLWTGILLNLDNIPYLNVIDSRISNNPVENYFNTLRNNILRKNKKQKMLRRLMPSQYISRLIKYLAFKYYSLYDDQYSKVYFEKPLINYGDKLNGEEKWSLEKRHFSREKGFYFNKKEVFNDFKNVKSNSDHKPKNLGCEKTKRLDFFKEFLPKNGGRYENFEIINTCSIDYFLISIAFIFHHNKHVQSIIECEKSDIFKLLDEIKKNILENELNKARYIWLKKIDLVPQNKTQFNCMLSVFDAFYSDYSQVQTFSWFEKCRNKTCRKNKKIYHSSHLFKLCKKKKKQELELESEYIRHKNLICETSIKVKGKCKSDKDFSDLKFTFNFPPLIIAINCYDQAKIQNIPLNFNLDNKKYSLFGLNLHKENHFVFYLYENNIFYKMDNLSNRQINETQHEINWKITHVFYELNN